MGPDVTQQEARVLNARAALRCRTGLLFVGRASKGVFAMSGHYRLTAVFALCVSAMLLAGCGGGNDSAPLVPDRNDAVGASGWTS